MYFIKLYRIIICINKSNLKQSLPIIITNQKILLLCNRLFMKHVTCLIVYIITCTVGYENKNCVNGGCYYLIIFCIKY